MVKYPQVKVKLVGTNGNAFAVMGKCQTAARKAGLTKKEINDFLGEATKGNYDHLLCTCMKWFNCS